MLVGVIFSTLYWGYPWSRPAVDARVADVRWTGVGSFKSENDGTRWALQPRDALDHHRDFEEQDPACCDVGAILDFVGEGVPALTQEETAQLEAAVSSLITLEQGEPGYAHAARLHGVLVKGVATDGSPVAFASFFGGEVSNDHHAMYEVFVRLGATPTLLGSKKYYGDIAGIEFATAWVVALVLLLPTLATAALLVVWWHLLRAITALFPQRHRAR